VAFRYSTLQKTLIVCYIKEISAVYPIHHTGRSNAAAATAVSSGTLKVRGPDCSYAVQFFAFRVVTPCNLVHGYESFEEHILSILRVYYLCSQRKCAAMNCCELTSHVDADRCYARSADSCSFTYLPMDRCSLVILKSGTIVTCHAIRASRGVGV
jgi:hypothetical protein